MEKRSWLFLVPLLLLAHAAPALGQEGSQAPPPAARTAVGGFEVEAGLTTRAQALTIYEGREDTRLAMMTSEFVPSPYLRLLTPFRPLWVESREGGITDRAGYYWKFAVNEFSLDFQEDPYDGGIGTSSARHDYGTRVEGSFSAVAPVFVVERVRPDGTMPWTIGLGMGVGYLSLSGDAMIEEPAESGTLVKKEVDFGGATFFLFVMARYLYKELAVGFEMGMTSTMTEPYSYGQSYLALDVGLRMVL